MSILSRTNEIKNQLEDIQNSSAESAHLKFAVTFLYLTAIFSKYTEEVARKKKTFLQVMSDPVFVILVNEFVNEISNYTDFIYDIIVETQLKVIELAIQEVNDQILESIGVPANVAKFLSEYGVDTDKIRQQLITTYGQPTDYTRILENLASVTSDFLQSDIASKFETVSPEQLINSVTDFLNNLNERTQTAILTESIKSFQQSLLDQYASTSVVVGWQWVAVLDQHTCIVCVYMHGQIFAVSVPFASHANCRCIPRPITKTFEELGIEGIENNDDSVVSGEVWFNSLSEKEKLMHVGPGKLKLLNVNKISLKDIVGFENNSTYGPIRFEKNLSDLSN